MNVSGNITPAPNLTTHVNDKGNPHGVTAEQIGAFGLNGGVLIPENADLNSYLTVGTYSCGANSTAQGLQNCPTSAAFTLYVYMGNGEPKGGVTGPYCYIIQEIVDIWNRVVCV